MSHSSAPRWIGGYHLLHHLGSGGSGSVWEAEDEAGTHVAFKLIHPAISAHEANRERLIREARLVNQIPGPGVARVVDFEADDTTPFVVTELITGPTLAQAVEEHPLNADEAILLATQLSDLLERVHGAGIVHRDLKPSNIILSDDGPVLIDFGIAQDEDAQRFTQTGMIMGTPGYVSPELLSTPNDVSFASWCTGDWWALHALLLSSLTGQPPFGNGPWQVVMGRVMDGQPLTEGLPPVVAASFKRALHPDPNNRGTTADIVRTLRAKPAQLPTMSPTRLMPQYPEPDEYVTPPSITPPPAPTTPSHHLLALILSAWLAVIPVVLGLWGLVALGAVLCSLSSLGAGSRWLFRRRLTRGSRPHDSGWAWATAPRHLVVGILSLVPGVLAAFIVANILWLAMNQTLDFNLVWQWWQNIPALTEPRILSWLCLWSALLVGLLLPTSRPVRDGINLAFTSIFPSKQAGVLFGSLAILALAFMLLSFI